MMVSSFIFRQRLSPASISIYALLLLGTSFTQAIHLDIDNDGM